MFCPSLFRESSAFLLAARFPQLIWLLLTSWISYHVTSKTSPGKSFFLRPMPVVSTIKRLMELGLCNDVLAYPRFIASYTLSVRQYRTLQSRCLQCIPHGKPPCDLLMLQGVTLAHKGLTPSGKIHPILRFLENKFVFLNFLMRFGQGVLCSCRAHTSYIKHLAVRWLLNIFTRIKISCNLIGNRPQTATFHTANVGIYCKKLLSSNDIAKIKRKFCRIEYL